VGLGVRVQAIGGEHLGRRLAVHERVQVDVARASVLGFLHRDGVEVRDPREQRLGRPVR